MTKAEALENLADKLSIFKIPTVKWFNVNQWNADSDQIVDDMVTFFSNGLAEMLAIRSSAADEDGSDSAKAGEYDSVLSVPSNSPSAIRIAIETVIGSYVKKGQCSGEDQVIVQEMLQNTIMSGVVFTHDLNSGAPYYVINYDDVSGLTNTVTSGDGKHSNRTLYIHRSVTSTLRSERFLKIIAAIQELETVMQSQFLDIEFAMGADLSVYLLQVRAITTRPNWNRAVSRRIDAALQGIQLFVRERFKPMYNVYGETTVLGQMPDWNPAEMIGRAPRALAMSLYKKFITDHAWRIAREMMGYASPGGQPLMVSLAGQPFIDTRLSFHSYLPATLPAAIADKLVTSWVKRLKENPELHDKVEFDVAITTYSFDIDEKISNLVGDVLNEDERLIFKRELHKLTYNLLLDISEGGISDALTKIEELTRRQEKMLSENYNDITKIFALVDDCIRLGTISFSILARHGFIAKTILLSLQRKGILSGDDVNKIQYGFKTVATELVTDMRLLQQGKLHRKKFMQTYGHLRPGTYDILSKRYDQMPELGTSASQYTQADDHHANFLLQQNQIEQIDALLNAEGFDLINADVLLKYIEKATIGREYGKFVFTKSVSGILEIIESFGEKHGLSREEMSHVKLEDILDVLMSSHHEDIEGYLRKISEEEAEKHAVSVAIRLPQVLFDEAGVYVVPFQISHANFITTKKISASCVHLSGEENPSLSGKIILIEGADPGFDWIFSEKIAGLITKYGGANSHMAIRCAEFGIPAAIGCGEQKFESLTKANEILLDCAAGLINPVH